MMADDPYRDTPTVDDLLVAPEMASIHLLDTARSIAWRSLRAVHPLDSSNRSSTVTRALASAIIQLLDALDYLIAAYRKARLDEICFGPNEDDIPY